MLVLHVANLLRGSIAGADQVYILPKDITGTSEAQTDNHKILCKIISSMH